MTTPGEPRTRTPSRLLWVRAGYRARLAKVRDLLESAGFTSVTVAEERGWTVRPSHARPNSDYYPFWRNGVETVFVIPGTGPYDGLSVDQSAELKRRWDRYHRPDDEWGLGHYRGPLAVQGLSWDMSDPKQFAPSRLTG